MLRKFSFERVTVVAVLVIFGASAHESKNDTKQPQNITLQVAENRLAELRSLLTDRLMKVDQIRSELGGRETSCSAQDQECSLYYRVKQKKNDHFDAISLPSCSLMFPASLLVLMVGLSGGI
jgi:hypothetical protein